MGYAPRKASRILLRFMRIVQWDAMAVSWLAQASAGNVLLPTAPAGSFRCHSREAGAAGPGRWRQ